MFRDVVNKALQNTGNQENLATKLDLSPSALSNKLNCKTGWNESEIDIILNLADYCTSCKANHEKEIDALSGSLRVILDRRNQER